MANLTPLIKWKQYQERLPTEEEIRHWWTKYPESNIGIITGKISGIAVLDVDTKEHLLHEIEKKYNLTHYPCVETPRGFHIYLAYKEGIRNTVKVGGQDLDIRGEAGFVVAPPSVNENGGKYKWIRSPKDGFPEFPMEILSNLGQHYITHDYIGEKSIKQNIFIEGRRDEDLFHAAHLLIKSNASEGFTKDVVMRLARTCDPPFPENEALIKVDSAVKRAIRKERPLAKEVEEWVLSTQGWFLSTEIYNCLQLSTRDEKKNVSAILRRLVDRGIIERHPSKNGWFRRIELECLPIDWQNAPTNSMLLKFPLGIEEFVSIYPGNVIIIAGEPNAGKTAFMLDFIRLNMDNYPIHYFNSEMGATELKIRLGLFNVEKWKFTAWERSDNFADVIAPDSINVIDYLEEDEDWRVRGTISSIFHKLKDGIAVIALQKQYGTDTGYGGTPTRFRARLYLSIGNGQLKIVKAKSWKGTDNPNRKVLDFKLYQGSEFSAEGFWRIPDKGE